MNKPKVALSACLMGKSCRYDGDHNLNEPLLEKLSNYEIVTFCPEEFAFGTPRPTMDLVDVGSSDESSDGASLEAISNESGALLSRPIRAYAENFFKEHSDVKLFIGKDRSPSCAVCSGKVYDGSKKLLHTNGRGLMAEVAVTRGIEAYDSEDYLKE